MNIDRATLVLFCQTLCLLGALGLVRHFYLTKRVARAMRWPTTPGVITAVRFKKGWTAPNVSGHTMRLRVFSVRLSYTYRIGDRQYTGSRTQFGTPRRETAKSDALARFNRYQVAENVSVHYDPQAPGECVLDPTMDPAWRQSALLAATLLIAGVLGWFAAFTWGPP